MKAPVPKPVIWMGDSLARLQSFPPTAQDEVGFAIYLAQIGEKHLRAKPLKGLGSKGIATPQPDIALLKQRLARAATLHAARENWAMSTKKDYVVGSGNVFTDLRVPHPEEALAKAELAHKITKLIERRRLTQAEAAKILDVDQPKVSALRCGRLSGFSLDRLVRFLVLLGHDVEIVVKKRARPRGPARLLVA